MQAILDFFLGQVPTLLDIPTVDRELQLVWYTFRCLIGLLLFDIVLDYIRFIPTIFRGK